MRRSNANSRCGCVCTRAGIDRRDGLTRGGAWVTGRGNRKVSAPGRGNNNNRKKEVTWTFCFNRSRN